jgi:DNA-binding response OmpR family regulator
MSQSAVILLVEDDASLGEVLKLRLTHEGYQVAWAKSIGQGRQFLKDTKPDLMILDVGLPDGSGFDLAKDFQNLETVFLTAQSDAESRLQGYTLGAAEFIPKPFHLQELLLRVRHVLREHATSLTSNIPKKLQLPECEIDFESLTVRKSNGAIEYPSVSDMKLLKSLIEASPKPVSRDDLMTQIWGQEKNPSLRTLDNSVVRLRDLLGAQQDTYIRSVRGVGYQWVAPLNLENTPDNQALKKENS